MSEDNGNGNGNDNEEEPTILEIVAKRARRWQLEEEAHSALEGNHISVLVGTGNNTDAAQLDKEGEALDFIRGSIVKDVPRTCRAVDQHKKGQQMHKHQHVITTDEYPDIIPGAYAQAGTGTDEENPVVQQRRPPQEQLQNRMPAAENGTDGLAVANPVQGQDVHNPIDLPTAQDYNFEASRQRNEKTVAFKRNILLAVILMIALIAVLVAALCKPTNPSYVIVIDDTMHPTSSPSPAPTSTLSFEDHVLSLLPDHSIGDIQNPQSSQFKALHWILDGDTTLPNERIQQRFALATLYHSTSGEKWAENSNWLNHSVHECAWYNKNNFASKDTLQYVYPGYLANFEPPMPTSCDSNGHYTNLWLDQNNLVGQLPRELYLLTSLQTVSLAMNPGLQGSTISTHIGHLQDLRGLVMFEIMLGGTVPTEIGLLTQLQVFGVNNNLLEGRIPNEIWQLTKLQTLSFTDNPNLRGSIPSAIGALSNLRWLVMLCDLTGTIPTEVGLLSSLEWFALGDNRLTGTLPVELSLLSNLVLLSVINNSLEGTIPSELGLLTSCTVLSLSANSFTGQIPKELFHLTSLRLLDLGENLFSPGTLPTEVGQLQLMEKLTFDDAQRIGPIPSELGLLTLLGRLNMRVNSFSGTIPEELMVLQWSLHTMSVEDNPMLSGTVPKGLCNINGTCIPDGIISCQGNDGLHGSIRFDCTSLLCGCNCATCNDGDS
ncbi:Leucine Rich Repeat [Seminavis robusta]|uniref:Leucine Rich Repeat n=1 Tax=Seminavis robusta TaxID=568900 RepID=A0A9N8ERV4_9STRA|nr:Leucine Rich Repeat [Seminavis robusta]|eukprot:Sro1606_g285520.1 Leucine Rich Repeat (715) ;mRNA; f:16624-18864